MNIESVQKSYLSYWQEEFGFPDTMPEFAKFQRQKYLQKKWTEEERLSRLKKLFLKSWTRKLAKGVALAKKIFRQKHYPFFDYGLLTLNEGQTDITNKPETSELEKGILGKKDVKVIKNRITLSIEIYKNVNIFKTYDVLQLYEKLTKKGKEISSVKKRDEIWKDPEEMIPYSQEDINKIKRYYDWLCPEKSSAMIYQQNMKSQQQEYEEKIGKGEDILERIVKESHVFRSI